MKELTRRPSLEVLLLASAALFGTTHGSAAPPFGANVKVTNALETRQPARESSVAVHGTNVLIGYLEPGIPDACAFAISSDGGATFSRGRIATFPGGSNDDAPSVAFGPAGEAYYGMRSTTEDRRTVVAVARSTDGGFTFGPLVEVGNRSGGEPVDSSEEPQLAVDSDPGSPNAGSVYVVFTGSRTEGISVFVARSTDGGASFSDPVAVHKETSDGQVASIAVAPGGDLHVSFLVQNSEMPRIGVTTSTDGGVTFSDPTVIARPQRALDVTGGGGLPGDTVPRVAAGPGGVVHVVYSARPERAEDPADIYYHRSSDSGLTFGPAVRLNDDSTSTAQMSPAIAVTADGVVGVKWWDRRLDAVNGSLTDVFLALSADGGATWGPNFRVTDHNWVIPEPEAALGFESYSLRDGLAADETSFYPSWTDARSGTLEIYLARIPKDRDPLLADFSLSARTLYAQLGSGREVQIPIDTMAFNGFTSPIEMTATCTVPGARFAYAPLRVAPGSSMNLTVSFGPFQPPQSILVTVAGSAGGLKRSTSFRLDLLPVELPFGVAFNVSQTRGNTLWQGNGLAVDGSGIVHTLYDDATQAAEDSDFYPTYRRSTDGGRTFSAPVAIAPGGPARVGSSMALDPSGNPVIVFTGSDDSVALVRSRDKGLTFSAPVLVTPPGHLAASPGVAVDRAGNILVAYFDFTDEHLVLARRSTDGGETFSEAARVTDEEDLLVIGWALQLAFDSTGRAFIAWTEIHRDEEWGGISVEVKAADDGLHFLRTLDVADPDLDTTWPGLSVGPDDVVHVAYGEGGTRGILYVRSTDGGESFSSPIPVHGGDAGAAGYPAVASGPGGTVLVAFESLTADRRLEVVGVRSADGGSTFGRHFTVSQTHADSWEPAVAIDPVTGSAFVAWIDGSPANAELFLAGDVPVPGKGLWLSGQRVRAEVRWRDPHTGQSGAGFPMPAGDAFGGFSLLDKGSPEVFVRVDQEGPGQPLRVSFAGLTDFEYWVTFTVAATAERLVFHNPAGSFDGGDGLLSPASASHPAAPVLPPPGVEELLRAHWEVSVRVEGRDPETGQVVVASGTPYGSTLGFFRFAGSSSPDVVIKVSGFGFTRPYLVASGGLTDREYTVTFTVLRTGQRLTFHSDASAHSGGWDASLRP